MPKPPNSRSRGRPPEGERISVRLPPELLALVDQHAADRGLSRAATVRHLLHDAVRVGADGVDRSQIRRMRALTPRERINHMAAVISAQTRFQGLARHR